MTLVAMASMQIYPFLYCQQNKENDFFNLLASKVLNVLLNPMESCNLVQYSQVTWNSTGAATINI